MKKIDFMVGINYMGGDEITVQGDSAYIAYEQLMSHKDIDVILHDDDLDTDYEAIIPYHAINYVMVIRQSSEVSAPADNFCGGESGFEVTLKSGLSEQKRNSGGQCVIRVRPYELVETMTLNGADVHEAWNAVWDSDPQSAANVEGGTYNSSYHYWSFPVGLCAVDEDIDVPVTYMYNGESITVVAHIHATGAGM